MYVAEQLLRQRLGVKLGKLNPRHAAIFMQAVLATH